MDDPRVSELSRSSALELRMLIADAHEVRKCIKLS